MSAANDPPVTTLARTTADVDGLGVVTVIAPEVLARQTAIVAERAAFGPVTEANIIEADALVGRLALHDRDVEARRENLKRPFLEAGRFIDAAAKNATIGDRSLVGEVAAVRRQVEARIAAEETERVRIASEAAAKVARAQQIAEESARVVAELEATATPEEAASLAEIQHDADAAASTAKQEAIEAGGRAYIASLERESRPMPKLATGSRKVKRVEIVDASKIPHMINGLTCTEPVMSSIGTLLKAGVDVPGARLVEVDEATAGRRR